ncbi:MAG TPA: helix-turn-helix transcriptional regulator [Pseudonocardiaceae bacterium]|nr:helix-turn-helix transcriptional regulator [Pseudonocardiaceae bacterium]
MPQPPNRPRLIQRRLAKTLRRMREEAGLTQEEASVRMEWSNSKLSRLENGETRIDIHWARSLLDLYDIAGPRADDMMELARDVLRPGWWKAYGASDKGYVPLEDDAMAVSDHQVMLIPGLLQTKDYAQRLLRRAGNPNRRRIANDLAVRMRRQEQLANERPLKLRAVIEEHVLRRTVGGQSVMRAQLEHLIEAAALPTVELRIMPSAVDMHDGIEGAFTVLEYEYPEDPDLVYLDHCAGSMAMEKPDYVGAGKVTFDSLWDAALDEPGSLALVRRVIDEVWSVE